MAVCPRMCSSTLRNDREKHGDEREGRRRVRSTPRHLVSTKAAPRRRVLLARTGITPQYAAAANIIESQEERGHRCANITAMHPLQDFRSFCRTFSASSPWAAQRLLNSSQLQICHQQSRSLSQGPRSTSATASTPRLDSGHSRISG